MVYVPRNAYIYLAIFIALFVLYVCLVALTSWILYKLVRDSGTRRSTFTTSLIVHIGTWWFIALNHALTYLLELVFWSPDHTFDPQFQFYVFVSSYSALFCISISGSFLSIDRCCVLLLSFSKQQRLQGWISGGSICFIVLSYAGMMFYLIYTFLVTPTDVDENCWTFICTLDRAVYMNLNVYGTVLIMTQFALSVSCLAIFRVKQSKAISWKNKSSARLANFTIAMELLLHLTPILILYILNWCGIRETYVLIPMIRFLFAIDGILTNSRYWKILYKSNTVKQFSTTHPGNSSDSAKKGVSIKAITSAFSNMC